MRFLRKFEGKTGKDKIKDEIFLKNLASEQKNWMKEKELAENDTS